MAGQKWTRDELIVAFNLYCKLRFGQCHSRNPEVVELARLISRTPDAVAMKLVNFASFDPAHRSRGVAGLKNAGKADRAVWDEFTANWERLAVESEQAYRSLRASAAVSAPEEVMPSIDAPEEAMYDSQQPTERQQLMKVRLCQSFFRRAVLASYEGQCCVCRLPCEPLLVASHIVPWTLRVDLRANPRNGLCLCALHDRAFDRGLISVNSTHVIHTSNKLLSLLPHEIVDRMFASYEGTHITPPAKFAPDPECLEYHFAHLFIVN